MTEAVALNGGVATFSTSTLALGTDHITAVYRSDTGTYSISTSKPLSQVVLNTSTTVTSSLSPSLFGQTITFTATVTSPSGTPAGKVTFMDGAKILKTVALSASGTAMLSTAVLTTGKHSITAVYSGNTTYNSSTSTVLMQTINAADAAILRRR